MVMEGRGDLAASKGHAEARSDHALTEEVNDRKGDQQEGGHYPSSHRSPLAASHQPVAQSSSQPKTKGIDDAYPDPGPKGECVVTFVAPLYRAGFSS